MLVHVFLAWLVHYCQMPVLGLEWKCHWWRQSRPKCWRSMPSILVPTWYCPDSGEKCFKSADGMDGRRVSSHWYIFSGWNEWLGSFHIESKIENLGPRNITSDFIWQLRICRRKKRGVKCSKSRVKCLAAVTSGDRTYNAQRTFLKSYFNIFQQTATIMRLVLSCEEAWSAELASPSLSAMTAT